jgi:hypothetical protein
LHSPRTGSQLDALRLKATCIMTEYLMTFQDTKLRCFHSLPFSSARFGEITADPSFTSEYWLGDFRWLEKQIGFYPLFLAFGNNYAVENTFYHGAEPRCWHWSRHRILSIFEFDVLENAVFTDFDEWVNGRWEPEDGETDLSPEMEMETAAQREWYEEFFKPSWTREQWFEKAADDCTSVQILVPRLDFRKASQFWTRGPGLCRRLHSMGFSNARVRKIENPSWWDDKLGNEP